MHVITAWAGAWRHAYPGLFGSVVGYWLYNYVLQHSPTSRAGVILLITPILTIGLGHLANNEAMTAQMVIGTMLVLNGLALHQRGGTLIRIVMARQH